MCGIAGQINIDGRPVDPRLIERMGERVRHRGPDDHGVYVKGHVGLAHRRLSILDLSPAGHQPMCNEDGTVWIIFNGEIYNYRELREGLAARHTFRSRTDTEVILHLYEDYGAQCVSFLRGMFAFAIWDERAQRLVLARDRIGKKPLFYGVHDGRLTFGSELKSLLVEQPHPEIDPVAVHHYLIFQYIPGPRTIFKGIRKLPPGHLLVYENEKVSESAYWTLRFSEKRVPRSEEECREEFLALMRESVRLRLASDVPLGAFLSGGLDSSTVVALMREFINEPIQTFSIGFREEPFNELPFARMVAERFGTAHHEFIVEPSAVDLLPTLVRVYDEPYADSSAIPTYCVSQLSRQFVTVVLNGDGGDELLVGYNRYRFSMLDRLLDGIIRQHRWLKRTSERVRTLIARLPTDVEVLQGLRYRLLNLLWPMRERYLYRICYFSPEDTERLYRDEFKEAVSGHDPYVLLEQWMDDAEASDLLDRLLCVDTRTYLPDDLLVKVDRATMAHGLEARSPLLDHRLMEFAASLPVEYKVRNGQSKYLMKAAMRGVLPDSVLDRSKMGFGVPIDSWFRHESKEFLRDILLSSRSLSRGYFNAAQVRKLVDDHQIRGEKLGSRLYALLMLELWHREYADGGTS